MQDIEGKLEKLTTTVETAERHAATAKTEKDLAVAASKKASAAADTAA